MAEHEEEANKKGSDKESYAQRTQQQSKDSNKEHISPNPSDNDDVIRETDAVVIQELRRSQRTRTFTARGQELHVSKIRRLQHRFAITYDRWKALAKQAKGELGGSSSTDVVLDLRTKIHCALTEVKQAYDDLRQQSVPDGETRRRADTCDAVSKRLLDYAWNCLEMREGSHKEQIHWTDTGSVFSSVVSQRSRATSKGSRSINKLSISSTHSSLSSANKQEAAAELAATQATLKILEEIECEKQALEILETEDAARKRTLEEKRRQIERLETVKRMNAARARLQVYEKEASSDEEITSLLHDYNFAEIKSALSPSEPPAHNSAMPKHITHTQPVTIPQPAIKRESTADVPKEETTAALAEAIVESINVSRLPLPEPSVFSGDPLRYTDWKMSFLLLIDKKNIPVNEKVYYLRKYVGGPARKAIESYFLLGTDQAYHAAWNILEERYGSSFVIAKAFRDKLALWPKIGHKDCFELREFVDFLRGCCTAMSQIKGLEILNDCGENQRILNKLPDWLVARWNRKAVEIEEISQTFPSFKQFVDFLTLEAKIACNPVTSLHALKSGDGEKPRMAKPRTVGSRVLVNSTEETLEAKGCVFCEKPSHSIHTCWKFKDKPITERVKFVKMKRMCFGCLKPGHHSKVCERRSICDTCKRKHPTCLHEDRTTTDGKKEQQMVKLTDNRKNVKEKERSGEVMQSLQKDEMSNEAISNRLFQDESNTHTSTVVPVWLSTTSDPENELLVYALLDNQSDTTFILKERAETLNTQREPVQLKISTLSSRNTVIPSQRLNGLQVRGFYSSKKIPLPTTYSREFIPVNVSHIPTQKTARAWPHLEHLAEEIAPLIDCDVGLLIGYDCSQALLPREVVAGKDNEPFAQRTDLGWSIIGHVNPCIDYGDTIGGSHTMVVKQVIPQLQSPNNLTNEVRYMFRTQVKEVVTPPQVIRALESDFVERAEEEIHLSQEDLHFLSIMKKGTKINADSRCEMPLPFKGNRPSMPDNQKCAHHRLRCLPKRFERDKQYHKDYSTFMNGIITRKEAEKVPEDEVNNTPAWYIPHHGVYHPQKPGKIRVVFDCSAKFEGVSLNDHLLTGPELTNTLVGVLCRFRVGPVAIMCDIECMFHQFHVRPEDQDYLRFLWWDNGDFQSQPSVYRMRVHLFGAASSPGCANYGLRYIAAQGQGSFSEASIRFIKRNFYVDDGLISVSTHEEAIQLVNEARKLCNTGKLRIHKFISNHLEVLAAIPKEDCAETVRNQDLMLGESQIERALGVSWCVASDQFQFRVIVSERPLSRRGVLSTVASIFDPLGFVAPFILVGKQILQQMCQDKIGWDEPLSEDLQPRWESWLFDLQNLSDVKISRCYIPESFKEVQRYELHHF
ncbi:uncharacterized protein [Channa argus]|uniref:uncharacterized protein n=1 Tax=Channa argus TaxID=215402 RepID=UPI00352091B9